MKLRQNFFDITSNTLKEIEKVVKLEKSDLTFLQGYTMSAFVDALAAYYEKVKAANIEAGLRSKNKYSPFPEEINRILVGHLADFDFFYTEKAIENSHKENLFVVGNAVIDALFLTLNIAKRQSENKYYKFFNYIDFSKKIILIIGHRRESFGEPFKNICYALKEIANQRKDIEIVYSVHLSHNDRELINEILKEHKRIHLIGSLEYQYFVWLMNKSYLVLSDLGEIQEEAPPLGKPVLVIRAITERIEGIEAGITKLVNTSKNAIIKETINLLSNQDRYNKMVKAVNTYGDARSSERIINMIYNYI